MDESSGSTGSSPDSRAHARQPIELKVEYKRLNSFFSDYTRNISKGGTFIKTTKPLDIGTEFIFKLYIPRLDEPMRITGRVQWVVTQDDLDAGEQRGPGEPGMGIRFIYHQPEDKLAFERHVEQIMVESLGQRLYSKLMDHAHTTSDSADGLEPFAGQTDTFASSAVAPSEGFDALMRRKHDS